MPPSLDCVFYIARAPEITFEEGVFHVTYDIGRDARFEVVMPPHVYLGARRNAAKAAASFEAHGDIVDMRAKH